MNANTTSPEAARACLADYFPDVLSREGVSLKEAEDLCIEFGHSLMASALGAALERLDAPWGSRVPPARSPSRRQ